MKPLLVLMLSLFPVANFSAQAAQVAADASSNAAIDRLVDHIVEREGAFLDRMKQRTPLVETYIQESSIDESSASNSGDNHPENDRYFLGRLRLGETVGYEKLIEHSDAPARAPSKLPFSHGAKNQQWVTFLPRGFAQMAVVDLHDFNRQTYGFDYVGREFLGEVRCLVFDLAPLNRARPGQFLGRIWVEDHDNSIVRFNGIYLQASTIKRAVPGRYFHFDSWRVNVAPGEWAPADVYAEEQGTVSKKGPEIPRFKAQTRFWDYAASPSDRRDELTGILIDSETGVRDNTSSNDVSPLESQRAWERQAEENVLSRLQKAGLLAPPGPVDEVLDTVVNNLIVSAKLNVEGRCRVLLTTPIETFTVGNTIVISRGLIDVLPDEVSLALVLATQLSHIALGHRTQTQYAFHNRTMLRDAELLQRFRFERSSQELEEAGKKTIEIMQASPYQKTGNAGLFLKILASRGPMLPRLLAANLGNQVANAEALARLAEFASSAPPLEESKLDQIAALPLGSRVKLNPWNNAIELVKTRPLALLSAREKMPFEVTPFVLNLSRLEDVTKAAAGTRPQIVGPSQAALDQNTRRD
jgi:hypothetical protein